MDNLSQQYEDGIGVEKNLSMAMYWCQKAAESYVPGATERLAKLKVKLVEETKPIPGADSGAE